MRRVRSKGKKLSAANHDDPTSDEEKIPTQKRRGRPHKAAIKEEMEGEVVHAAERDEDSEETADGGSKNKDSKTNSIGKKRKSSGESKGEAECPKDENLPEDETAGRSKQTRHRRKGKPCRAPEAVVECT